jgi:Ca2+-dependent lipid-binding protein
MQPKSYSMKLPNSLWKQKNISSIFFSFFYLIFISFRCHANHLDKKDFLGKSDPYFKIFNLLKGDNDFYMQVYESEVVMKTLDPEWKEGAVPLYKLCNSNIESTLRFEVWDWNKSSSHDFMQVRSM